MKLISWNVNGLRAVLSKTFETQFKDFDMDILCLQETKIQPGQVNFDPQGYYSYYNYAVKKGYSGTAVYSRVEPLSVQYGIGDEMHDQEGRVITCEYDSFFLVCVYTPNAQRDLLRLDYRMEWEVAFLDYIKSLDKKKPVVICGDLNVAHQEIDLKNPKGNRRNPGFTDEERGRMTMLLEAGFVDSFRYLYPSVKERYSWWSYRFSARMKNIGWRIDYFIVSERMKSKIMAADILDQEMGSDHAPVYLELNI